MIWVDFLILGVIGVSTLLSLLRGFIREAISLASWVAALWIGIAFFRDLSEFLQPWVATPSVRDVLAFAGLFVAVVLLGGLVNYLAGQLVSKSGLTATDRMLGTVFGVLRGAIIVAALVLLAGLTALPEDPWWAQSILLEHFQGLAEWLRGFLPDDVAENIQYSASLTGL